MVKRCTVGPCDNDSRDLENVVKRRNVTGEMEWYTVPNGITAKTLEKRAVWIRAIQKGRSDLKSDTKSKLQVCSNHFIDGKPTAENPFHV